MRVRKKSPATCKPLIYLAVTLFVMHTTIFPKQAHAVIPPDFIFNVGTQVAQFFSIILIFLTAALGTFFQFFKTKYHAIQHKKTYLAIAVFAIIGISLLASYLFAIYRQNAEYKKWLDESIKYNSVEEASLDSDQDGLIDSEEAYYGTDPNNPDTDGDGYTDGEEVKNGYNPIGTGTYDKDVSSLDENDKLSIGGESNQNINTADEAFVSKVDTNDPSAKFISDYYENIARGNLQRAYEMSKKGVDFATFEGWYLETTKITLDKLVRVDERRSSIELTLFEGESFTRYGVLMTLGFQGEQPFKVEKSDVKILAEGQAKGANVMLNEGNLSREYSYFETNQAERIYITNQEFKGVTSAQTNEYVVLDAREDVEFENGYFQGSIHIRFADLKAGRWIELPKDKPVYVLCWSGIRGKEVAEFLRTKKIVASYLEDGANGWVDFGGEWVGNIKFGEKYTGVQYQKLFGTDELKSEVERGTVLVDTREPYKYRQHHIAGSVNIPIMYTPTINLSDAFSQVPANSNVITVCDGYVNCFDAKITGIELERRGHHFLGRYNTPWEYDR